MQRSTRMLLPALARHRNLRATYSTQTDNPVPANNPNPKSNQFSVSQTNALARSSEGSADFALQETPAEGEEKRVMQAPNRPNIWSRSQQPRAIAMTGPRFEQTIMEDQPRPFAAIELIHKQPVRWTKERSVSCDGGGGPLGHPRIFINVDKPQINWCTYCGVPFANEHHRKYLESLPSTSYPLAPTEDTAQVPPSHIGQVPSGSTEPYQSSTGKPLEQR